jgi:Tol biopolymer transport system component
MKHLSFRLWAVLLVIALGLFFVSTPTKLVQSQDPSPVQTIESDNPRVFQNGTWSSQSATPASNGSYLFSSGAESDILGLSVVGSAIEIIYVAGPQFGTLAIEIDGTVLRTVISTSEKIEYGLSTHINYLSNEPHSLKIYAQSGGIIAIDAFRITPLPVYGEGLGVGSVLERGPGGEVAPAALDDGGIQSSTCAPVNVIHRVSLTTAGQQASDNSGVSSLSNDGRYVTLASAAVLVPGDSNAVTDVYLYDRQTCAVERISTSSAGVDSDALSGGSALSADGRYVIFDSIASNLVAGDTNSVYDLFIRDRQTGTTSRLPIAGVTQSNGTSYNADISPDARFVTFESNATNLVAGDTNFVFDIFVLDRNTTTTTRVSIATGGTQANDISRDAAISADGRFVAFYSFASNLVAGDTNGAGDVFVHDRNTGTTTRVSIPTGGGEGTGGSFSPDISADGRYVVFESGASNLVAGDTNGQADIFLHDRTTGITSRVSVATGGVQATGGAATWATISADGRFIAFASAATNLVAGDTNGASDIFVHDRITGVTTCLTISVGGGSSSGNSNFPVFSADGRFVAFQSSAPDLVSGDTNGLNDAFVAPRTQPSSDNLALFQPAYKGVLLLDTLADNPPANNFTFFSSYAPVSGGQWIMGDWDGDGLKTPGVYLNGAFHYTNDAHETKTWQSLWIGVNGPVVAGAEEFNHDCVGAVNSANFPPFGTAFVLYLICDLSGNPTPPIFAEQWLSVLLPDSGGFSGTHQFVMGDWDGNGSDTIAVRRGAYITWTNDSIFNSSASFPNAQYFGAPGAGSEGILVDGDWDRNGLDSFGLFYQNGEFFYRNDLLFNSGAYGNQSVGQTFAGTVQASTWR